MRCVWDMKGSRPLLVTTQAVIDEISRETFAVGEYIFDENYVEITLSSYEILLNALRIYYGSNMMDEKSLNEINKELRKYEL
ncbi:hypothetical protein QTL97_17560 [Sporosarcina thermotolerans]|uniref:Uncharacterized protein n=1 Tax=Sporosarcina thermotolerans TaxID=633404 RepID=A0AAW9ACH4_9BACL|nr:hypothetical protein [Sporosarcina thermotolerans]MDW0118734.1 hypothetical protein [Sporosarcina thermotolerans]